MSKKAIADERLQIDRREASASVVSLMASQSVGRLVIPMVRLQDPDDDIKARELNREHVDRLMNSMCNFDIRMDDLHITAAIRHPDARRFVRELNQIHDPAKRAQRLLHLGERHDFRFETITGQHTRNAMDRLASRFTNNPKYQTAPVTVYILEPTKENQVALAHYGVTDNQVRSVQLGMNMSDLVDGMHRMINVYKVTGHQAGSKDLDQSDIIKHFCRMGLKYDTARGYYALASVRPSTLRGHA